MKTLFCLFPFIFFLTVKCSPQDSATYAFKPTGQGTGLGLSLSYDIIAKEHGGTITVETKEGEGAEFVIELPVKSLT